MPEEELILQIRRLRTQQRITWFGIVIGLIALFLYQHSEIRSVQMPDTLKLHRLDIIDSSGTSRVILASPAPPPTFRGQIKHRDGVVSGLLIADASGTERGGYVTSDGPEQNALFTLDAAGKQTVLLLAEPDGNTLFRIWNQDKGSLVMGVSNTNPFLNVRQPGQLIFSAPLNNAQASSVRPLFK